MCTLKDVFLSFNHKKKQKHLYKIQDDFNMQ